MGSRDDELESSPRVWLDCEDRKTRRPDLVHGWGRQEWRSVDDQFFYETWRRPDDEVLERIAYEANACIGLYRRSCLWRSVGAGARTSSSGSAVAQGWRRRFSRFRWFGLHEGSGSDG